MLPMVKAIGFTLPGSTATTRPAANRGSIQRPITTAPAAWRSNRGHCYWPPRIGCDSTSLACLSYRAATRWRKRLPRGKQRPAPKGSPARGLKGVCAPEKNIGFLSGTRKPLGGFWPVEKATPFSSPPKETGVSKGDFYDFSDPADPLAG